MITKQTNTNITWRNLKITAEKNKNLLLKPAKVGVREMVQ